MNNSTFRTFIKVSSIIFLLFTFYTSNAQNTISGHVYYSLSRLQVTTGKVYVLKYEPVTETINLIDSATLNCEGRFLITTPYNDSVLVCTGWIPEVENEDHVLTYYPSSVNWQNAKKIYPPDNLMTVDIYVNQISPAPDNLTIAGTLTTLDNNLNEIPLPGASIIAVSNNKFINATVTDSSGNYTLDSLVSGAYSLLSEKLGYTQDSLNIIVGGDNYKSIKLQMMQVKGKSKPGKREHVKNNSCNLYQNFPNPFNPLTKIRFTVNTNSDVVKINIYDLSGKEISTLLNEKLSKGEYEITWDGSKHASGVYFVELETSNIKLEKRMLLIK